MTRNQLILKAKRGRCCLYFSLIILRGTRLVVHVRRMGDFRDAYTILTEENEGKNHLGDVAYCRGVSGE
jgi:hypothetical protein